MGESRLLVEELLALCLQRIHIEDSSMSSERELVAVVRSCDVIRQRWLQAEAELKTFKELLVKSDVSKAALEVKLKHARNQLDVEMKKRYKLEGDFQYLQRQMQLMCDILVHDSKSSAVLNPEQKSLLAAFDHKGGNVTLQPSRRLCVIDESSFLSHSDISYDRTDDDVDVDTTSIKPLRSRARERRRTLMGSAVGVPAGKRRNVSEVGGLVQAGTTLETTEGPARDQDRDQDQDQDRDRDRDRDQDCADQTSVWLFCEEPGPGPGPGPGPEPEPVPVPGPGPGPGPGPEPEPGPEPKTLFTSRVDKTQKHLFSSKTVIRPESCSSCSKRIRFGKVGVKCRNCRVVTHPECKHKINEVCSTSTHNQQSLESLAPPGPPRIPRLLVDCVAEIERRGLEERGLYRVPGVDRVVRDLRDQDLQGKTLILREVQDVHVVCGLLKDLLRRLPEPLVTHRLHRVFMEASELPDDSSLYRVLSDLPRPNRETLAFLMLHLHKVMRSPRCQMDQMNLSRVFGPSIVGHSESEPSPESILRDSSKQPKVVSRLLSLPEVYWRRVLSVQSEKSSVSSANQDRPARLFKPLTSPEVNSHYQTPRGRTGNHGNHVSSTGRYQPGRRFFTSPS